jgi:hypothetical protein
MLMLAIEISHHLHQSIASCLGPLKDSRLVTRQARAALISSLVLGDSYWSPELFDIRSNIESIAILSLILDSDLNCQRRAHRPWML